MVKRTVDLLPEIFKTETNRKFLNATLDQLVQEPNLVKKQGYIGRKSGPGIRAIDSYLQEPTKSRSDYQLEPGVVFSNKTGAVTDAITYPGILDALQVNGANITKPDRMLNAEYYAWDSFCDLDKFVNYGQYYWLPDGPDAVDVFGNDVPLSKEWSVQRGSSYRFSSVADINPVIKLVRGGTYQFTVNQPGSKFWIQAQPGITGIMPGTENVNSREVFGVSNNGAESGTVEFKVPTKTEQDFYYNLATADAVDLVSEQARVVDVHNTYVDEFLRKYPNGIDGITNLEGRTVVFVNRLTDATAGGWQLKTVWDAAAYDTESYGQVTDIADFAVRYSVWKIVYEIDSTGRALMQLQRVQAVENLSKFPVRFGTANANTEWYKTATGVFDRVPLLTAVLDTLWYQDGSNPDIFGRLLLVEADESNIINIEDIVGASEYTSPNGVRFTNGLKVRFQAPVNIEGFVGKEFYVEGVGSGPGIANRVGFIDGEAYFGPWHEEQGRRVVGSTVDVDRYQAVIFDSIAESVDNAGLGFRNQLLVIDSAHVLPDATADNGITLTPVDQLLVFDDNTTVDYVTVNRAARSRNAWSRVNRWTHADVIAATAEYNNSSPVYDAEFRAKRPIIEFRPNLGLFNSGSQALQPIDVIDTTTTDAFSQVAGQLGYAIDGHSFVEGTRVVFLADTDSTVRNKIWKVEFIEPTVGATKVVNLVPAADSAVLLGQSVLCTKGNTQRGTSYWFNGVSWSKEQVKTSPNQSPRFDIFDSNGRSYSDAAVYPSTTFAGSNLFGYAVGSGTTADAVLGFPLRYQNINNVGDIVFTNFLATDTFTYVRDNVGTTERINKGTVREFLTRSDFKLLNGWTTAATDVTARQVFTLAFSPELHIDVPLDYSSAVAPLQVFVNGVFVAPENYAVTDTTDGTTVLFAVEYPADSTVEFRVISKVTSSNAFYSIPVNLENNPLSAAVDSLTLGTIRNHYETIGHNLTRLQGPIIGKNNSRDCGRLYGYGTSIVQHACPFVLPGVLLRNQQFDFFDALQYNSLEYTKFKALLFNTITNGDFEHLSAKDTLDDALGQIAAAKSADMPFYSSDMLPHGQLYTESSYVYSFVSNPVFDTTRVYDFTQANENALLVYVNDRILTRGVEYTVSVDSPTVEITIALKPNDLVLIREYASTAGSFVPCTPSKLGLYPAYRPIMYVDTTYAEPVEVIRGHDGSISVAHGDFRDLVMLEFETRIFNNIKVKDGIPMDAADVIPGQFRTTDYSMDEVNRILSTDFLTWVGQNKVDYTSQAYRASNQFSFNYASAGNRLTGQSLLGNWRGIYRYFYDTYRPDIRPWEMLGITQKPDWWEPLYGPAPYTSGNRVLWDDLAAGIIRDPANTRVEPKYARPGLLQVLPVDSAGNLLSPLDAVCGSYVLTDMVKSWEFGDIGPTEYAWRTSSSWPFAVMRLLALTQPARFFSLCVDRSRYNRSGELEQMVWENRSRLTLESVANAYTSGNTTGYLNWVVDYNRRFGVDSAEAFGQLLESTDVRLVWRLAGFTDKSYLRLFTDRATPSSSTAGEILPDESYHLLMYRNQPFKRLSYSSVIVQKVANGWSVLGYDQQRPYFTVQDSDSAAGTRVLQYGPVSVRVPTVFKDSVQQVPYGFVFNTAAALCEFLVGYGAYLQQQGLEFENTENSVVLDWYQMAIEYLGWTQQGWAIGTIINLNPVATKITVAVTGAVVDNIFKNAYHSVILNQNRQQLNRADIVVDRDDNKFSISTVSNSTINFLQVLFTSYESAIVFDNRSIFSDLIYDPSTGTRQTRVLVKGWTTSEWTGSPTAPGFIINQHNVKEWSPASRYAKGEIVSFKNEYWTASTAIEPSDLFDVSKWLKSDYDPDRRTLLPNAATQSLGLQNAYSSSSANLEQEIDLFGYGLIGFRPRPFMQSINLDDASQVGVYKNFIKSKGTATSALLFSNADLGRETADYSMTEYWAVLRGYYGATANRNYIELLLNNAALPSNPSVLQLVQPQQASSADMPVLLDHVWKSSRKLTNTQVFPTVAQRPAAELNLPTAGYANIEDVDFAVFNFDELNTLSKQIDQIGIGTRIWVANTDAYNWNVYTAAPVPGKIVLVSDNLNNRARIVFDSVHNLAVGDTLVVKFYDTRVNGVYQVKAVPDLVSVLIEFAFPKGLVDIDSTGIGLTLTSLRVQQAADVTDLPVALQLTPGARVWVDNSSSGQWQVLEKTSPYQLAPALATATQGNQKYGIALSQGMKNLGAIVGATGHTATGAVGIYAKNNNGDYEEIQLLGLLVADAAGYGNAVDVGDQQWAIVGASASAAGNGYAVMLSRDTAASDVEQQQLLLLQPSDYGTAPAEFGFAVTMSQNEQWAYVGAPGINCVYAFAKVAVEKQSVTHVATFKQREFVYSNSILIDDASQLLVTVNGQVQSGSYYYVNQVAGTVIFAAAQESGNVVTLSRKQSIRVETDPLAADVTTLQLDQLYSATETAAVTVLVNNLMLRPGIDYSVDTNRVLTFVQPVTAGAKINIRAADYWVNTAVITAPAGTNADARFGESVTTTTDGRKLIIGASNANGYGRGYVYDRAVESLTVVDSQQRVYSTTVVNASAVQSVTVNNSLVQTAVGAIDPAYSRVSNGVEFSESFALAVGDVLTVDINAFALEQVVESLEPVTGNRFGMKVDQCVNDCSLYVSSPYARGKDTIASGKVEFFINQSRVYGVSKSAQVSNLTVGDSIRINNRYVVHTVPANGRTAIEQMAEDINAASIANVSASVSNGQLVIGVKNLAASRRLSRLSITPGVGSLYSELGFNTYVHQQTIVSPVQQHYAYFGAGLFISDDAKTLLVGAPEATAIRATTYDSNTTSFDAKSTTFADSVLRSGVVYSFDYLPADNESVSNPGQFVFGQQIVSANPQTGAKFGSAVDYTTGTLLAGAPGAQQPEVTVAVNRTQQPAWRVIRQQQPVVDVGRINSVYLYNRRTNLPDLYLDFYDPLQGRLLGPVAENINYIGSVDPAAYNIGATNNYGNSWQADREGHMWLDTSAMRFLDTNQDDAVYASRRWGQLFPGSRVKVYQWVKSSVPPAEYEGPGVVKSLASYVVSSTLTPQGVFAEEYFFWVTGITEVSADKTLSAAAVAQYIENPRASGLPFVAFIAADTVAVYNIDQHVTANDSVLHIEFDRIINDSVVHSEYNLVAEGKADGQLPASLYTKLLDSFCGVTVTGAIVPDPFIPVSEKYGVSNRPRQGMFVNRFAALENYLTSVNQVLLQHPIAESRRLSTLSSAEPEPGENSQQWNKRVNDLTELSYQDLRLVPNGYRFLVATDDGFDGKWAIYQVTTPKPGQQVLSLVRVQTYSTQFFWDYADWYSTQFNSSDRISKEVMSYTDLAGLSLPVGSNVKVTANTRNKWEVYQLQSTGWQRVAVEDGTIQLSPKLWDYSIGRNGYDVEVFDTQFFDQEPTVETRQVIQAINNDLLVDDLALERNRMLILMFNYVLSEQQTPDWLMKTSLIDVNHVVRELEPFPSYRRDNQGFVADYINEVKPYHTQVREFNLVYNGLGLAQADVSDFDLPAQWDANSRSFISPVLDAGNQLSITSSTPPDSVRWQDPVWENWYNNYTLVLESVDLVDPGQGYTIAPDVTIEGDAVEPARAIARINGAGQISEIQVLDSGTGYLTTPRVVLSGGNGSGARAVPVMGNPVVRSIKTTIKFDRVVHYSSVAAWQPAIEYPANSLVRYADRVWTNEIAVTNNEFELTEWTLVPADQLNGVDRTMGYYVPTVNKPGLDLSLLVDGTAYPGVQVKGLPFDQSPGFDFGAVVNRSFKVEFSQDPIYKVGRVRDTVWSEQAPGRVQGEGFAPIDWVADRFTGGPGFDAIPFDASDLTIEGDVTYSMSMLDTVYSSEFTNGDPFLGYKLGGTLRRPLPSYDGLPPNEGSNPIAVEGGGFVDHYSSAAPEEMIPGSTFDTLDIRVTSTLSAGPESGAGMPAASRKLVYRSDRAEVDIGIELTHYSSVLAWNQSRKTLLVLGTDYTINWATGGFVLINPLAAADRDIIVVTVYRLGGGEQLFVDSFVSNSLGNSTVIQVASDRINEVVAFINGRPMNGEVAFVPLTTYTTTLTFPENFVPGDRVTYTVFGPNPVDDRVFDWSAPVTETFVATNSLVYPLSGYTGGTNALNAIVTKNGFRARPSTAAEYTADSSTIEYLLPEPTDLYPHAIIAESDVSVYVNDRLLTPGVDFEVTDFDGSSDRAVLLTEPAAEGDRVLVTVSTDADYLIQGNQLVWLNKPGSVLREGDQLSVTTWNDTQQQDITTVVFQGPVTTFRPVFEGFDPLDRSDLLNGEPGSFDYGENSGEPGSFDYSGRLPVLVNRFEIGREVTNNDKIIVTLDGGFLFEHIGYNLEGSTLVIPGPAIGLLQVLTVTMFTEKEVPGSIAFRVFKDMLGNQTMFRITESSTTELTQPLLPDDDIIYVKDAKRLSTPSLPLGIFGFITINGERISYRYKDLVNNTVYGLRRGTAGTGAAEHAVYSPVYDISITNQLPAVYQDAVRAVTFTSTGGVTHYATESLVVVTDDSTEPLDAVTVRVGGRVLDKSEFTVESVAPVAVTLKQALVIGVHVQISLTQSRSMYEPGPGTASNGIPLQAQTTSAARFIRSK